MSKAQGSRLEGKASCQKTVSTFRAAKTRIGSLTMMTATPRTTPFKTDFLYTFSTIFFSNFLDLSRMLMALKASLGLNM